MMKLNELVSVRRLNTEKKEGWRALHGHGHGGRQHCRLVVVVVVVVVVVIFVVDVIAAALDGSAPSSFSFPCEEKLCASPD